MRRSLKIFILIGWIALSAGCGRDEKSSAERDAEVQKTLQEGMQKERQMYEGTQKQMEALEKSMQEQKEKK